MLEDGVLFGSIEKVLMLLLVAVFFAPWRKYLCLLVLDIAAVSRKQKAESKTRKIGTFVGRHDVPSGVDLRGFHRNGFD